MTVEQKSSGVSELKTPAGRFYPFSEDEKKVIRALETSRPIELLNRELRDKQLPNIFYTGQIQSLTLTVAELFGIELEKIKHPDPQDLLAVQFTLDPTETHLGHVALDFIDGKFYGLGKKWKIKDNSEYTSDHRAFQLSGSRLPEVLIGLQKTFGMEKRQYPGSRVLPIHTLNVGGKSVNLIAGTATHEGIVYKDGPKQLP